MPSATAREVMTTDVVTVDLHTPLKAVAALIAAHGFRLLPVVAADGALVGVVAERDFILKQAGTEAVARRRLRSIVGEGAEARASLDKIGAATAGEAMTAPAIAVDVDDRIERVAAVMIDHDVDTLPVTAGDRLVGILTRSDLVRLFTGADEALAEAVSEEILRRTLLVPPDQFLIRVTNGVVTVRGHVERAVLAHLVVETIARHPAVIRVDAEITSDDDLADPVATLR